MKDEKPPKWLNNWRTDGNKDSSIYTNTDWQLRTRPLSLPQIHSHPHIQSQACTHICFSTWQETEVEHYSNWENLKTCFWSSMCCFGLPGETEAYKKLSFYHPVAWILKRKVELAIKNNIIFLTKVCLWPEIISCSQGVLEVCQKSGGTKKETLMFYFASLAWGSYFASLMYNMLHLS